jgi:hypothetical protein
MHKLGPFRKQIAIEVIVSVTLAVLAVLCFVIQMRVYSSKTTGLETALFNLLQFLLTIGFSWYGSRAISRTEFEGSLKKFALSAYRRVCDIDRMLERLQYGISNMLALAKDNEYQNLRVVSAIVDDTKLVINSSISDWADVIGDELLALREINRLEEDKQRLSDKKQGGHGEAPVDLSELQKQIESLKAKLPAALQMLEENSTDSRGPNWLASQHFEQGGLLLQVVAGADYSNGLILQPNEYPKPLLLRKNKEGSFDLCGADGTVYGRLLNFLPLPYYKTMHLLTTCYGKSDLEVECIRIIRQYQVEAVALAHIEIRVLCEPKVESSSWLFAKKNKRLIED